jgi:glycerol-3-phosphate dehydrogenase
MRAFMRRSVRLIDEFACSSSENQARISLSRTGYLYAHQHPQVTSVGEQCSVFQQSELLELYPWLSSRCTGGVLAKNAGWLSAHGLGMALLSSLQGSTMMIGWDFVGAMGTEDRIQGVRVRSISTKEELQISCGAFVNATGPSLSATHQCALESLSSAVNAPLPVHNDLHAKVIMHDVLRYFTSCTSIAPSISRVMQCHSSLGAHDDPELPHPSL